MNRLRHPGFAIILIGVTIGLIILARDIHSPRYPTPRPGTGTVVGKLDWGAQENPPYNAQDLYLGRLIRASQLDVAQAVSFTYGVDPQTAIHNPDGTFAFTDIPPGSYALVIWTPGFSFVIENPEGGLITVTVEADKTTDLGMIILH